jgi:uncharacterized repeat protein (TIGR02059 family)
MSVKSYWYVNYYKQIFANSPAYGGWKASGGDSFKIALCPPAYVPNQDTHISYNDILEVSGQGYQSGGQVLTGKTISTASGALVLGANPVSWAGCVFTVRRAVIYDDSNTGSLNKQLVRWIDFEQDIQLAGDTILLTFDGAGEIIITPPADSTPPVLSFATIDGPTLVLGYNEILDTTSVPATLAYTVLVNGVPATVSSVAVASTKVVLILATAVVSADIVLITYVVPVTGYIRDLAFNPAVALSSFGVTNLTTPPPPDPPPPDVTPPVVAITFPADLATISNTITVTVTATDVNGVVSTVLYVDGVSFSTDTSSPYSFGLDTTSLTNGAHTLIARAIDPNGNIGVSATVNVTVSNVVVPPPDTISPTVSITSPLAGAFLAGTFTVAVTASDNVGVVSTTLFVNGVSQGVDPSQPYSFSLNTTLFSDGSKSLVATATDAATNTGTSSTVSVVFDNTAPALSIATVNGATLTLNYSESLNTASVPLTSAFVVKTDGNTRTLNSVSVSGSQVLLTLAVAVFAANSVTVSYTAGATPIEDRAGNNAANLTNNAVINQTPGDTLAPTITALDVNGATLTIQYSETLDPGSVPATSAFLINVTPAVDPTVTLVVISGRNVTLTLSTAVLSTETVAASYTQPLTNKIRDLGQNNAASFFNLPVQNLTPPVVPPEPTAPVLSSVSAPDSQSITWNNTNVANETGYDYESSPAPGAGPWTLRGTRPADTVTFTWTGAVASTQYYMRLASIGPSGFRYYSNVLNVTTPPGVPVPPPEPTAPVLISVSAPAYNTLIWNHTNVADELGYEYYSAPSDTGGYTLVGTNPANSTTFTWDQASALNTYLMKVSSFGAAGTRYDSNVLSVTTPAQPVVDSASFVSQLVPSLTMSPGSSQNVTVTMKNLGTATWNSAGNYHLYSQNPSGTTRFGLSQVPVAGSILPNGNAAFNFSIVAPTSGNATVSWNANTEPDLAGYRLYYGTSPGVYGAPIDVGNVLSYTISGLTTGITYYFAVAAYDTSNNESAKSTEVSLSSISFPFQWRMRHTTTEFGSQSPSVSISVLSSPPVAATYVSTTGSDTSGNGTITAPFRTIQRALTSGQIIAGRTLFIRGGNYIERVRNDLYSIPAGVSFSNAVTISGYQSEVVTIRNIGMTTSAMQYIIFQNLTVDGAQVENEAVYLAGGSHHIRFQNVKITQAAMQGVLIPHGTDHHHDFLQCEVFNNGFWYTDASHPDGSFFHGMYMSGSDNTIDGCLIHDNSGYGYHGYNGYGGSDRANRNTVKNCRIYRNGITLAPNIAATGLLIGSGDANTAYNNLIYDNRGGLTIGNQNPTNCAAYFNSIFRNGGSSGLDVGSVSTGAIVRNNISFGNTGVNSSIGGSGTTQDHNLIGQDPLWVNATSFDFHLRTGSPAINNGIAVSGITTDFANTTRGNPPEIGAYEF